MSIFNVWLRALYEYLTHNASILREAAKKSFFLVAMPSPPPLSGRATKKIYFLRLPLGLYIWSWCGIYSSISMVIIPEMIIALNRVTHSATGRFRLSMYRFTHRHNIEGWFSFLNLCKMFAVRVEEVCVNKLAVFQG